MVILHVNLFLLLYDSLWFFIDSNCSLILYLIMNDCYYRFFIVMKSIFLIGLSFCARTYWTRAQLGACFANSHVTRDDFLRGFFCLPAEQSNSHFVCCSSRTIASRRRSCKTPLVTSIKTIFLFRVCVCVQNKKREQFMERKNKTEKTPKRRNWSTV